MSDIIKPLRFRYEMRGVNTTRKAGVNLETVYSVTGAEIRLHRVFLPLLLNIYLPTFLLVATSWMGFFVPSDQEMSQTC